MRGFTLIEIMVAIAIVAMITALAIPGLNYAFRTNTESFSRQMAAVFRETRDRALLKHQIVRLKFDLKKQEYWVEEAPSSFLLPSEAEAQKAAEDSHKSSNDKDKDKDNEQDQSFRLVKEITPKHRSIPYGIKLVKILSPRYKEPISDGEAEVYYMTSGISDAAILHIEDMDKNQISLLINPVTGGTKQERGFSEADR